MAAAPSKPLSAGELRKLDAYWRDDMPEIRGWRWGQTDAAGTVRTSTEADNV